MSVIEIDWKPDDRKLRQFALVCLVGLGLIGLLVAWKLGTLSVKRLHIAPVILWLLAGGIGVIGIAIPRAIKPVYLVWMAIAFPIGWIVSHLVLAVIYFLVFTTVALIFRLIGRDVLCRRLDREAKTYWFKRGPSASAARYFRQF